MFDIRGAKVIPPCVPGYCVIKRPKDFSLNDSFLESVINDIEFHKKDFLLFPVYPFLARR